MSLTAQGAAMVSHEHAVSCQNVTVRFVTEERAVTALDDVSFTVPAGGFLTLLGPSGCGKSTLLRVVADLITPGSGTVEVLGKTAAQARMDRSLGFVFQDAALLPWRSVWMGAILSASTVGRHAPARGDCPCFVGWPASVVDG
jgi:NitT/TauT family transport system ATP-binding protein